MWSAASLGPIAASALCSGPQKSSEQTLASQGGVDFTLGGGISPYTVHGKNLWTVNGTRLNSMTVIT